jgi:hypothetical protein
MGQGNQISKMRILELLEVEISLVEVDEKLLDRGGNSFVNLNTKMKAAELVDFKSEGTTASGTS